MIILHKCIHITGRRDYRRSIGINVSLENYFVFIINIHFCILVFKCIFILLVSLHRNSTYEDLHDVIPAALN